MYDNFIARCVSQIKAKVTDADMLMNSTDNEPLECENEATTLPSTLAESEVHAEHSETTGLAGYSISDTNAIGGTCDGGLYNHT